MRLVQPPRIVPAVRENILQWAIQAQRSLRDISVALGEISQNRPSVQQTASSRHPFKYKPAAFVGEGDPPSDQFRKFQVLPGAISHAGGVVFPDNLSDVFTAAATGVTYFWLRADFTAVEGQQQPEIVGITLASGATLPEVVWDSDPKLGTYPASSFLLLFTVEVEDGAIKEVVQYVKSSLSLTLVVNSVSCGQSNSTLFWAPL
jgi:hypothetical protein